MKFLFWILVFAKSTFADICICQYPNTDTHYGQGKKGEIGFYKLGCAYWYQTQKDCRLTETIDINDSLKPFLDKRIRSDEKIKIGYVGHWSGSYTTLKYLDNEIKPLLDRYRVSIEIDNTACEPLNDPKLVYNHIKKYELQEGTFLRVEGAQGTSIGMWDKLSRNYRFADLLAYADTRETSPGYPDCSKYLNQKCTKHQANEYGYCKVNSFLKRIYCNGNQANKEAKRFTWRHF